MAVEVLLGLAFACHLTSAQLQSGAVPDVVSPSDVPVQAPTTPPQPVSTMAYGSDVSRLYIQGGVSRANIALDQFYYLDFTVSWNVTAPAWKNLSASFSGSSGTLDPSKRFIVAAANQSNIYIYDPNGSNAQGAQAGWTTHSIQESIPSTGPILTTNTTNSVEQMYYFGSDSSFMATVEPSSVLQDKLNATPLNGKSANIPQGAGAVSTSSIGVIRAEADTSGKMVVQLFSDTTQTWTTVGAGAVAPARTGHCFVPSNDGTRYYLFGGTDTSNIPLSDFYSFDINKKIWTTLPGPSNPRTSMACAVAGNLFIVWGGSTTAGNAPLLYDIANSSWEVDTFVPTTSNPSPVPPGDGGQAPSDKPSSSVGAIVGGIVAGVVVVAVALGFLFIRRRKPAKNQTDLARSGGKSEISQESIEMGGYKSIPPPFKSDESYQQSPVVAGTRTPYSEPPSFPSSSPSPSMGVGMGVNQHQQGPVQPRAQSQMSNVPPPIIQSPFEPEPDTSSQHLLANPAPPEPRLLHSSPLPAVAPLGSGPYHDRQYGGDQETTSGQEMSRDMEPATIDLIPIAASEAEEGSQVSRSNSLVSTREGRGVGSRNKSIRDGGTGGLLKEPEDSRRDSTESLDYLDIS
ncbi:hypothetical protein BGZ79_004599 [Entomortierella chlamydospora]|nr:hypothetical protein BGZ79_004599 [Entomortierella chlamydospora]